jgi:lipopolysaccharide/colanic/teichoic acid biosynthesis glycosyltransferase
MAEPSEEATAQLTPDAGAFAETATLAGDVTISAAGDTAEEWPLNAEAWERAPAAEPRVTYAVAKRALDIAVAALALLVAAPLLALLCIAIVLDSPGAPLLSQPRVGRDRRSFRMYKLRSMRGNAPPPPELLERNEADGHVFKIRDDPRLTRVGRFLRKTSLDELPQLWNVMRGEMSLVGPRPPLEQEVARYNSRELQRLRVTPGMTGLWQVEGRSDLPFARMLELDLQYIERRSLTLDVAILLRTAPAVLSMRGAY